MHSTDPATEPTCQFCGTPIYRRNNCVTCSAECSRTLRAHKALTRPPCLVCGEPVPSRRGSRVKTCSEACSRNLMSRRQQERSMRIGSRPLSPEAPEVSPASRWFASMRFPHQRRGYAPRWGR